MNRLTVPVVALVAVLAVPATAAAQKETETVERTLRLPADGTLSLKNFSGEVRITAGGGDDVVIKAVRRAERPQLDHIKLEIRESGSTIAIDANKRDPGWKSQNNNVVETEFDIQVPARAHLDVDVFSSKLTVTGVTGRQKLKTFSGDVIVRGARGEMNVKSFNGDVELDLSAAGERPTLEAETFSGEIQAKFAGNARGRIEFNSFSGDFESDVPLQMRSTSRRKTSADLPGGTGDTLNIKTFSGTLRVVR